MTAGLWVVCSSGNGVKFGIAQPDHLDNSRACMVFCEG